MVRNLRMQTLFLYVCIFLVLILVMQFFPLSSKPVGSDPQELHTFKPYNFTYPITPPLETPLGTVFRIGIISDFDTDSKSKTEPNTWVSYYKKGDLTWNPGTQSVSVEWDKDEPILLKGTLSQEGRGMELSDLVTFNGKLYSFDDRTGIVYEINGTKAIPWVYLNDGDGRTVKGFKSEWACVKDKTLYVGGLGKEWTTPEGLFQNYYPMWVKAVTAKGEVSHLDWVQRYQSVRRTVGIEFPGYMLHESAAWSDYHQKWVFLPRRQSSSAYHEDTDPYQGTNVMITTDVNFTNFEVVKIGEVVPTHGFSSFKFIPGTKDGIIVALKTEELKEGSATYIMSFTMRGEILLPETKVANAKYEGFEFI